jgi:hypothetical protein
MATAKTKLITPVATLSYPHLATPQEPQAGSAGKAKYSAALVFKPGQDLTEMQAAAMAVAEAKWPGKAAAMFAAGVLRTPFRKDGEFKGYAPGSVFVNVRSEQKPQIVSTYPGPDGKPLLIEGDDITTQMYAGAQVRASVTAFAYDAAGNKGVSFALGNIQKVGEDRKSVV